MQEKLALAAKIFSKVNIPTIPEEIICLKEELNKKYPNTVTIANLISHNPELLGDFLTLVNTNITNEKTEIKDAKAAVNVLGLDEIYNIFLSSSLTKIIAQSPDEKAILTHGAQSGLAAAELSYWVFDVSRSEAYMAGLMQNIGAIYFARSEPESYMEIYKAQLSNPISAYDKELETYHTTHAYLGTFIAKKWHINPDVYKSILLHHDTNFASKLANDQKVRHIVSLIMLSNYVVSTNSGEQYITQELKEYRDLGKHQLSLPDNALKAANAAVIKWGNSVGLSTGSH
ncbi:histidine kinase [Thiomicrorhabdus immobilis]|uniref:Histidine kinase n=1 Tax=Thiomicrorhabdus immobilis TaxID=2791037 RepID=A0ABM7MF70_9GAMM|nr:HDOD domain-containing protein [Thiomicrorhabdus immobilis]BCN94076.1 histidine kinase [Thiomicrorhabdus immobilis]